MTQHTESVRPALDEQTSNTLAVATGEHLPSLLDRACRALAGARDSGEVLEARDMARVAYDAAKSAGRMARVKKAHDNIISAVYRAQADALLIEARAKMRLADEYDDAQERGEVATGNRSKDFGVADDNAKPATAADLGFRRDEIHDAREIRNAEREEPGLAERALNALVEAGQEPTRAALKRAADEARNVHVANNSGNNEWYTPPEFIEAARECMGWIDLDPASSEVANARVRATEFFSAEDDALSRDWPDGRIWMNPPYSKDLIPAFIERFCAAMATGRSEGVVLVNNATETAWFQTILASVDAVCFPRGRIKYLTPDGTAANTPLQGQALLYCGPNAEAFAREFRKFGVVIGGTLDA